MQVLLIFFSFIWLKFYSYNLIFIEFNEFKYGPKIFFFTFCFRQVNICKCFKKKYTDFTLMIYFIGFKLRFFSLI